MLTLGQSACLVLDMSPTEDNRKKAKKILEETPFTVTYLFGSNPLEPVAMARSIVEKNPFKYRTYPATPPTSPTLSPVPENSVNKAVDENKSTGSEESYESLEFSANYGKRYIISLAKNIFVNTDPQNDALYTRSFFTNQDIYDKLEQYFPKLKQIHTPQQLFNWLATDIYFGKIGTFRVDGVPKKGRHLWTFKEGVIEHLQETSSSFRTHTKSSDGNWINVGYVRKSPTNKSTEDRVRLLKLMITRLVNRCFCEKMFVSPISTSSSKLLERDHEKSDILAQLLNCDGDTQDLFAFLSVCTKKVRLCIIDYAGLSTDPNDIFTMLKFNKAIKEVAIDHGSHIEVLDRFKLLHGKDNTKVFKSRTGFVKRSKV